MHRLRLASLLAIAAALALPLPSAQAQDAAAGEAVFKKNCAICHTTEPGKNKIGPSLAGIVGRKAGSVPNYT